MKKALFFILLLYISQLSFSQQLISFTSAKELDAKGEDIEKLLEPTTVYSVDGNNAIITHHFHNAVVADIPTDEEIYTIIRIKGYGYESEIGKPQLPGYTDLIPLRKNNATLQMSYSDFIEYKGIKIIPAQIQAIDDTKKNVVVCDRSVYDKNEFYPKNIARIENIQDFRGQKYALVRVNPVQYNPITGVIRCYKDIQYRINNTDNATMELNVRNNNDSIHIFSKQEKYIIVTSNNYLSSINEFVKWKECIGYHVSVLSKDQWTDDVEVRDSIRSEFCRDSTIFYPRFLLVVGDYSVVPAKKMMSNNIFQEPHYLTDHYYACIGDDTDVIEDIARGRIPFANSDSIRNFLKFIIQKEKNPLFWGDGIHSAYFNTKDSVTEDMNFVCSSEEIRDFMIKQGYNIKRVYKKPSYANPLKYSRVYANGDSIPEELRVGNYAWDGNANDISSAFYDGCDYISYQGHGTVNGLDQIGFKNTSVYAIQNNICTPLFLCFACECGRYASLDNNGVVYPENNCFAVTLMQKKKSCGIIASSGVSHVPYIVPFEEAFFSSLYLDSLLSPQMGLPPYYSRLHEFNYKRKTEIGEQMRYAHTKMLQSFGFTQNTIKETTHMHVYGDPSYHFPTSSPCDLDIIDIYRFNDSICINLNEISSCTIIFIQEDCNGNVHVYKRLEDLTENYCFIDSTNYNRIIIKKNNSAPVVMKHVENIYLQNISVNSKRAIDGNIIMVGNNVTNLIPNGNVIVKDDGLLKLKHVKKTILDKGFKVEIGGKLSVTKQ